MLENKRYCINCLNETEESAAICPHCQHDGSNTQQSPYLKLGSVISDRYQVGKAVAMANDSITYIGLDKLTGTPVNICEYFPNKIAHRENESDVVTALMDQSALLKAAVKAFTVCGAVSVCLTMCKVFLQLLTL